MNMGQGTVKWFSNKKGFGFIKPKEGNDLFVHYSDIKGNGYRSLFQGDVVEFEVETNQRGLVAKNVNCISRSKRTNKKKTPKTQKKQ